MPMTPEQLKAVKAEVSAAANLVGGVLSGINPALVPFVVIGKGVASMTPDLVQDVELWIANIKAGKDPTDEENAALAEKIASLQDPGSL